MKHNDPGFISEKEEYEFEEQLKRSSHKKFLEYGGLKLALLHSWSSERSLLESTVKFVRGVNDSDYYLVDVLAHRFCEREDIWGMQIVE